MSTPADCREFLINRCVDPQDVDEFYDASLRMSQVMDMDVFSVMSMLSTVNQPSIGGINAESLNSFFTALREMQCQQQTKQRRSVHALASRLPTRSPQGSKSSHVWRAQPWRRPSCR